jgi:hypothetical protein
MNTFISAALPLNRDQNVIENRHKRPCIMKSEPGPPMTLGNAAAARVRLIVWCRDCQYQVEPDPAKTPKGSILASQRPGAQRECRLDPVLLYVDDPVYRLDKLG